MTLRSLEQSCVDELTHLNAITRVDARNAEFYGLFPYPWPPASFSYYTDPDLGRLLLHQDIGDYLHRTFPKQMNIWVAGCGTNQAVYTALTYPNARIVGSDLSETSLEVAENTARQFGLSNLSLRHESINEVSYRECFDLIICTGVIHHNADPRIPLKVLHGALKPAGVLELMVYNQYHRLINHAIQEVVRILAENERGASRSTAEMKVLRKLLGGLKLNNFVGMMFQRFQGAPEAEIADALIQPVESSYSVRALDELLKECDVEYLCPLINHHDLATRTWEWYVEFGDAGLQQLFDEIPDVLRWQIVNLLLLDKSPMLWFYCQRNGEGRPRKSEREINEAFLDTTFRPLKAIQRTYLRQSSGRYELSQVKNNVPSAAPLAAAQAILSAVDGKKTMRQIFDEMRMELTFGSVLRTRNLLTTSAFPYILPV